MLKLRKTIFTNGILALLVCLPFTAYANSDSARIGISVEIKSKQSCDYSYTLETGTNISNTRNTQFSECDLSIEKLQQQANQLASSGFTTIQSHQEGNRLRFFMTVQ